MGGRINTLREMGFLRSLAVLSISIVAVVAGQPPPVTYIVHNTPLTWFNARQVCLKLNGDLASVHSAHDNNRLLSMGLDSATHYWIGFNDIDQEGTYVWSDGSSSTYTDWDVGQPDGGFEFEDCVAPYHGGKWHDFACSDTFKFICGVKGQPPSVTYVVHNTPLTWLNARQVCLKSNGDLASVHSAHDNNRLLSMGLDSATYYWIGYNDIDQEGTYVWSDGSSSTYTNWDAGQPNGGYEDCIILHNGLKWHDIDCSKYTFKFICGMKATIPTISTFCLPDRFGISIKKDISSFASVTLKDPSCKSTSNRTHITLSTSFSECATSKNETKEHIIVSNEVRMLGAASGIITRANYTIIPFVCKYSRSGLEISLSSFNPKVKSLVHAQESGFGNFTLNFRMARTDLFGSYYNAYPVAVQINDRLYFQISLNANNTDTALLIERCYATSTLNKNGALKYALISNRCPTDSTVQFHSGAIHNKKFSFLAFNFLKNVPTIYMHCEVYLCHQSSQDSRCTSGCGINKIARKRRDIEKREIHGEYSKIYVVENGPIQKSKAEQGDSTVVTALTVMGVIVGVLCLTLVAIFIVKTKKRLMHKASQKTVNSNGKEGFDNNAMEMDGCA